jgi:endoglucanase
MHARRPTLGFTFALHALAFATAGAQQTSEPTAAIRLNQLGFLPSEPKTVVVVGAIDSTFLVASWPANSVVLRGTLSPAASWTLAGERVRRAELTGLNKPGRYVLTVPGVGTSIPFDIGTTNTREVARAAIKAFYYQRAGTPLPAKFAGKWARAEGHPDTVVLVHSSAATSARPAGTRISAPRGWYDAGDYNKYIVNSGISTYTLLLLAEQFPAEARALSTNIPESGNGLPDILNEALWNIRWMLAMQDPNDGGVYHKLTSAAFDNFVRPDLETTTRYVVQKGSAATFDFAAVMAHASLLVRHYPHELPGLADTLTRAALAAWRWGRLHPDSVYDQERLNAKHTPPITTGAYGDTHLDDERRWAAAELAIATKQDSFLVAVPPFVAAADVPTWSSVGTLGLISLAEHRREMATLVDTGRVTAQLLALARGLRGAASHSPYGIAMVQPWDFVWGSNAVAANQGLVLVQAERLTGDTSFLRVAASNLDYILGRNATGYSFVTGFGAKTPWHPHHRPSATDTVVAPVPGMLVGGPNPGQQDHCPGYPSTLPARSYIDAQCAYAANEIAINWNAPFAYLAAAVDASYGAQTRGK